MEEVTNVIELAGDDVTEIGPNDLVIHLVNPYKCGLCENEYLEPPLFMKHMLLHLEDLKRESPTTQLMMTVTPTRGSSRGVTITRDILQLDPDGSIRQVKKLPKDIKLNQVKPLRELEEAGVISLDSDSPDKRPDKRPDQGATDKQCQTPHQHVPATLCKQQEKVQKSHSVEPTVENIDDGLEEPPAKKHKAVKDSAFVSNDDGTFSFSFKALKEDRQQIEIVPISHTDIENIIVQGKPVKKTTKPKAAEKKTFECEICGKHLSCSTSLSRHRQYHKEEKPYVCEVCHKGFKDNSNLKKHTLIHKREFACHLCKKSFLHKALLTAHLRHHESRSSFIKNGNSSEEVIIRTTVTGENTQVEIMRLKSVEGGRGPPGSQLNQDVDKTLTCNGSNRGDSIDPVFGAGSAHGEIAKLYRCDHCGKETMQRGNMMKHLLHHLEKKPYSCVVCSKQFVDKGELIKHENSHTRPFKCQQCKGAFTSNAQLQKHIQSQCLGNFEQLNYTVLADGCTHRCNICGVEMKRLGAMIKHMGTHDDDELANQGQISPNLSKPDMDRQDEPYFYNPSQRQLVRQKHLPTAHGHTLAGKMWKVNFRQRASLKSHLKKTHCRKAIEVNEYGQFIGSKDKIDFVERGPAQTRSNADIEGQITGTNRQYLSTIDAHKNMEQEFLAENVSLREENRTQSKNTSKCYSCEMCQRKFNSFNSLSNHLKSHREKGLRNALVQQQGEERLNNLAVEELKNERLKNTAEKQREEESLKNVLEKQHDEERLKNLAEKQQEEEKLKNVARKQQEEEKLKKAALAEKQQEEEKLKKVALAEKQQEEEKLKKVALAEKQQEEERLKKVALVKKQQEEEKLKKVALAEKQQEEERLKKVALVKKQQEEEKLKKVALAEKQQEEERLKKVALVKKQQEEEKLKKVALAEKQQEEERLKKVALAKKQQEEERLKKVALAEKQQEEERLKKVAEKQEEKERLKDMPERQQNIHVKDFNRLLFPKDAFKCYVKITASDVNKAASLTVGEERKVKHNLKLSSGSVFHDSLPCQTSEMKTGQTDFSDLLEAGPVGDSKSLKNVKLDSHATFLQKRSQPSASSSPDNVMLSSLEPESNSVTSGKSVHLVFYPTSAKDVEKISSSPAEQLSESVKEKNMRDLCVDFPSDSSVQESQPNLQGRATRPLRCIKTPSKFLT